MTSSIKHKAVKRIWLVPMAEDGQLGYVWCDDPAPGMDTQSEDAVEYVRADTLDRRDLLKQVEALESIKYDYSQGASVGNKPSLFMLIDAAIKEARQQAEAQARSDCELECGAFGTYCKCKTEYAR